MRILVLALVLLLSPTALPTAAAQTLDHSCIRFVQPAQRWILDRGVRESPTLAGIADALCGTDVIAYVQVDLTMRRDLAGSCGLFAAAPHNRFVIIRLNSRLPSGLDRIATLSHELEHALHIGRARWVRTPADVLLLQRLLSPHAPHSIAAERVEAATRQEVAGVGGARLAR
jgi:hypothetical protein